MERLSTVTRARTIVAIIATAVLVMSFALVATLINRQQASYAVAPGCPDPAGRPTSSIVGASYSVSSLTATYSFDSLVDRSPSAGVPGLIEYCVFASTGTLNTLTPLAHGDDASLFDANTGSGEFSFSRHTGNPSNIGLDGTTGIVMGTATWTGAVPSGQTILLHINDAEECHKLYGVGTPETCFVLPGSSPTPTPTATPAGQPTPTSTPPYDPTATPTIPPPAPTPTGTLPPGK